MKSLSTAALCLLLATATTAWGHGVDHVPLDTRAQKVAFLKGGKGQISSVINALQDAVTYLKQLDEIKSTSGPGSVELETSKGYARNANVSLEQVRSSLELLDRLLEFFLSFDVPVSHETVQGIKKKLADITGLLESADDELRELGKINVPADALNVTQAKSFSILANGAVLRATTVVSALNEEFGHLLYAVVVEETSGKECPQHEHWPWWVHTGIGAIVTNLLWATLAVVITQLRRRRRRQHASG